VFKAGELVSPKSLVEKELIKTQGSATPSVKILGKGELTKKLEVRGCAVSASAKAAIEKAGGSIK
jgi:large subunit ribosomal protein L15